MAREFTRAQRAQRSQFRLRFALVVLGDAGLEVSEVVEAFCAFGDSLNEDCGRHGMADSVMVVGETQ